MEWKIRWVPVPAGNDNDDEGTLDDILALEEKECSDENAGKDGYVAMMYLDPVGVLQQTFVDPDMLPHIIITPYRDFEGSPRQGIPKDPSDRRTIGEVYSADFAREAQVIEFG